MTLEKIKEKFLQFSKTLTERGEQCRQLLAQKSQGMAMKWQKMQAVWKANHYFTFSFVPANGQDITKTHIKRSHIKYVFSGTLAVILILVGSCGYMAHLLLEVKTQQAELAAYKQTKQEQEATIKELRKQAEKNQQQLAAVSKLEDQVRTEMKKNGTQLPPKTEVEGGKGGSMKGNIPSKMHVVLEQEKNIQAQALAKTYDLENLLGILEYTNAVKDAKPSFWPTSDTDINSYFGGRSDPFGDGSDWHSGIDIDGEYGNPVYASASGIVEEAGWVEGYGRYICIDHGYGYETAYGHMSDLKVSAGQSVEKGQLIGLVGSSGYSTGPHLHFEVMVNGKQVNPLTMMKM